MPEINQHQSADKVNRLVNPNLFSKMDLIDGELGNETWGASADVRQYEQVKISRIATEGAKSESVHIDTMRRVDQKTNFYQRISITQIGDIGYGLDIYSFPTEGEVPIGQLGKILDGLDSDTLEKHHTRTITKQQYSDILLMFETVARLHKNRQE